MRRAFKDRALQQMYEVCVTHAMDPTSEFYFHTRDGRIVTRGGASHRCMFWNGHAYELGWVPVGMKALRYDGTLGYAAYRAGRDFASNNF